MQLANLPDEIRGFGHVKERNVLAAATKRDKWLAEYRSAADQADFQPVRKAI